MKKFLSLMLAMIMVMSLVTVGAGAVDFTDEETIQYNEAVAVMSELGILTGTKNADGTYTFYPQGTLTRQAAAKIIAYIALGADDAEDLVCVEDPFTDVPATKTLAPYINWAAKEGIITGYDDGTFKPSNNVSGHAFLKMVLGALGIEGTYAGEGWRVNVTSAAAEADLFKGIDTNAINLRADATRELACQIAFNAMFYSDEAVQYEVLDANDDVIATFDSKDSAEMFLIVQGGVKVQEVKSDKDTLAYTNYGLTVKTPAKGGADEYGRPATVYYEDGDAIVYAVEAPVLTIKGAATEKEIFTALGKSGYQGAYNKFVMFKELWADGVKQFSATATKADGKYSVTATPDALDQANANNFATIRKDDTSAWACGNGAVTEIYATSKGNEFKAVVTNEYLGYIGADPVKANADKGTNRKVKITVYGIDTLEFETEEFAKKDYVLVTMKNGKIDTAKKITPVKNVAVEKYIANESVTFGGETYKFSQKAKYGSFGENLNTFSFEATYNFYLDSQNNVIAVEIYDAGDITNYAYITKIQAQASTGSTLLGNAKEDIVVAEVIFADGTKKVVDLKLTEETVAGVKTAYVDVPADDGKVATKQLVSSVKGDDNQSGTEKTINYWFGYEANEDGTYTFSELHSKAGVTNSALTLEKGKVNTDLGKTTTSKTNVTSITTAGAVTKGTGLVDADLVNGTNNILYIWDSNNYVTAIYAVKQNAAIEAAASDYVYALEQGATLKGGIEWTFAEDGKETTYVIDNSTPVTVGTIYTLTTEEGKIKANALANGEKVATNVEVKLVDEAFILVGSTVYYVTDKTAVYLVEDGEVAADTLVKGDKCTFLYTEKDSVKTLVAAYITDAK